MRAGASCAGRGWRVHLIDYERHYMPWLVELTPMICHYGMVTARLNAFEVGPRADGLNKT